MGERLLGERAEMGSRCLLYHVLSLVESDVSSNMLFLPLQPEGLPRQYTYSVFFCPNGQYTVIFATIASFLCRSAIAHPYMYMYIFLFHHFTFVCIR
jgi:hypothetical protein